MNLNLKLNVQRTILKAEGMAELLVRIREQPFTFVWF